MRVLFLTHRLPHAPNRGDRVRAFHIVRELRNKVDLEIISLAHDVEELEQAQQMSAAGFHVSAFRVPSSRNRLFALPQLLGDRPLTHLLLDASDIRPALRTLVAQRPPDVVLAYCSSMARFAVEPPLRGIPLVIDLVDVDSAKWSALADTARGPKRWVYRREADRLSAFERDAVSYASYTVVVNEREARLLKALVPQASIGVLENGVDHLALTPPLTQPREPTVVFCGVMNYGPNVEAVEWFAKRVWPQISIRRPDASFKIVGSDPTPAIRELHEHEQSIIVTGSVADVRPHLWNAAVSVAPLMLARGVQNKVLEAIAAGLPVIVTPEVIAGLPPEAHPACRVAASAETFADETLRLLAASDEERRGIAHAADLSSITWEHRLAPLEQVLRAAADAARSRESPRFSTR